MIGKRKVWFSLVLIVVFLGFTGSGVQSAKPEKKQYENLELIAKVLHFVETNYVEEVEEKELIYGAINGIMGKLDPHSSFLNPETFRDMKIETSGKFGGIGIEITVNDKGELTIVSPIDDTPAYKAGLKSGDYIIQIEDKSTKDMPLIEAVNMMRGKPGTIVRIKIFREGFDRPRDFKIRRAIIKVKSVKYQVLEQGYGYLKLSTFQETTAKEAQKAIKDMISESKEKGFKGLVLDLRNNPGGLLNQAEQIADLFLDEGVIVSTVSRNERNKEIRYAHKNGTFVDFPIVVLVNGASASASEIVAGALQDHGRALILGNQTFGKGSVQTVIELDGETGLKLTVAKYYTPNGISIQGNGITPDVTVDQLDPDLLKKAKSPMYRREKDLPGHIVGEKEKPEDKELGEEEEPVVPEKQKKIEPEEEPGIETPPGEVWKRDYQLNQALNMLKAWDTFKKILEKKKMVVKTTLVEQKESPPKK
ncbi:MAG TPA: S41 family peptidase [Bdellovibrionota bacterium]|nr:S41 family peptidase [Bdellovibrionota bacterium]